MEEDRVNHLHMLVDKCQRQIETILSRYEGDFENISRIDEVKIDSYIARKNCALKYLRKSSYGMEEISHNQ